MYTTGNSLIDALVTIAVILLVVYVIIVLLRKL